MTTKDFQIEIKNWKLTRYRVINFGIGILSLLLYEFIGRPVYRPYIYKNNLFDFHFADTLGNTLGTLTTIFFLIAILSHETQKGNYLIKLGSLSVVIYELAQPLLGNPIDFWDIGATVLTGILSYFIYNGIFQ